MLLLTPVGFHFAQNEQQHWLTRHSSDPQPSQHFQQPLKFPQYVRITPMLLAELVDILELLHTKLMWVHRDVSAANIFRTADGKAGAEIF